MRLNAAVKQWNTRTTKLDKTVTNTLTKRAGPEHAKSPITNDLRREWRGDQSPTSSSLESSLTARSASPPLFEFVTLRMRSYRMLAMWRSSSSSKQTSLFWKMVVLSISLHTWHLPIAASRSRVFPGETGGPVWSGRAANPNRRSRIASQGR